MTTIAGLEWIDAAQAVLARIRDTQATVLEETAQLCAKAIAADGLVHLFGTGHSRIPVEEMFPRYGSYPGFHPIVELSMTFHTQVVGANGQRQAMFIERQGGLAEVILDQFTFGPDDVMMVFSVGGSTAVPIEMARGARARGLTVVAVTSLAQSRSGQPDPVTASRLFEEADSRSALPCPASTSPRPASSPSSPTCLEIGRPHLSARRSRRHRAFPPSSSTTPELSGSRSCVSEPGVMCARSSA